MSVKKTMGIIVLVGIAGMLIFGFFLYFSIKTKSTDISRLSPFSEWTGKTLTLELETVLLKEKLSLHADKSYPYLLLDSLHPEWPYIEERIQLGDYSLEKKFPAGTKFHMGKAVQFTGGVSGYSTPFVFGTISYKGENYNVAYKWGTMDIAKYLDKVKACWQFPQAPWQSARDTAFYALPEAKWW